MKIKFRDVHLSPKNKQRLNVINSIIEEYQNQGYILTLRQLYYQLVSRDVVPNKQSEYSKLSTLLKEGRMSGIVDWDAIEDRLRRPSSPASFDTPEDLLDAGIQQYQLPRMEGQKTYVEVWVEKDALSGVLSRVTRKYHIPILVNRGYSSVSAMYDSYNRFKKAIVAGQKVVILYLGDYDPSGIDMIRDIEDRIKEFLVVNEGNIFKKQLKDIEYISFIDLYPPDQEIYFNAVKKYDKKADQDELLRLADQVYMNVKKNEAIVKLVSENFSIKSIALTKDQIRQYDPPPNPAKVSDPRAKDFIEKFGDTSWEVDALKPEVLNAILTTNIKELIDSEMYDEIVSREEADKEKLENLKQYL
jgi:hypothetical protein